MKENNRQELAAITCRAVLKNYASRLKNYHEHAESCLNDILKNNFPKPVVTDIIFVFLYYLQQGTCD